MLHSLPVLLAQQTPPTDTPPGGGMGSFVITMILMLVIFYFLLIRPQRKRQRELQDQVSAMKNGDHVVTIGGIHGLVTMIKDSSIILKVADNTRIEFEKTAVASVFKKDKKDKKEAEPHAADTPAESDSDK